tara:strand:+ start:575 stop:760 length:186 start_codon:yes stop_codon:yes gene_type:complete
MIEMQTAALMADISAMEVQLPLSWIVIPSALAWMGFGLYLMYADMKAYGEYMRRDRDYQHY